MRKLPAARAAGRHHPPARLVLAAAMMLWLAVPSALRAQSTAPTLQQAVALALQRHPDLVGAQHEVEAARGATEQAGLLPNPELSASMEDTRRATRTTAVQLSQRLELGGKRDARRKAAELAEGVAQARLDARRSQVRADVEMAYRDVLGAQDRLELAHASSALAGQVLDAAGKRVAAGKVSPLEATRARLALSGALVEAHQAGQELAAARTRLSALLGQPLDAAALPSPADAVPAMPQEHELAARLEAAPSVVEARIEVRRREAMVELERARRAPDLTVGLGAQRDNELGRNQALLAMSLPLPLFDRNQGNLREAMARANQARDELAGLRLRLLAQAQAAASQLQGARQQVQMVEQQMLPDARQAYEAATTGYALGKFGFLDVLDAQRTLFLVRSQHLRALSELHRAATELVRLLGYAPAAASN